MGRAARTKRQRQATRTWHTRNPWTGKRETFQVCISDQGLHEWEERRVRLAKAGYPDRPPEFLSRNLGAAWNHATPGRPFRPGNLEGTVVRLAADRTAKMLGTWQSFNDEGGLRIEVGRRDDGTFVLALDAWGGDGQHEGSAVFNYPDEAAARAMIERADSDLISAELPPLHWTSAEEMLAEIARAA